MTIPKRFLRITKTLLVVLLLLAAGIFIFFSISTAVTTNIDNYEYELPFEKGAKYRVVQGYGGLFSHKHIAALDFNMPAGTPVYAAREGIIYSYKDDSDEGGPFSKYKKKANYIIIKHDDGSFGCYWHLQKNGVLVKHGRVSKGQQIGISGATGLVLRPHLHFSVKLQLNYQMNSFTRTKFNTTKGVMLLKRGETYERPTD
jgi:murein DD-endopeptidase MepM/ murein hydrolase activator NlpD